MPGARTAMHQAAEGGHHEIIRVLARAGADIFAQDLNGMTPLGAAMTRSRWMAALELMRCGAEPRVRVCETEGAYLRALRIAREADVNLIAVYWCGGNLPALSDKFIEVGQPTSFTA
jgi:ankyrin repeat protein